MLFQKRIDGKGALLLYQVFSFKLYTDVCQMSTFQGPNCSRSTFRRLMCLTSHFCLRITVLINLPFWEVCILIPQVIVLASNTESIYFICFTYLYFYSNLRMYREVPMSFPVLNQVTLSCWLQEPGTEHIFFLLQNLCWFHWSRRIKSSIKGGGFHTVVTL